MTIYNDLQSNSPETMLVRVPDDDQSLDAVPRPISWRARDVETPLLVASHRHRRVQLLYASKGIMTVRTDVGFWVVPPQRAVWIPSGENHEVRSDAVLHLRSLYFDPSLVPDMPDQCSVVSISPLLRELILAVFDLPVLYDPSGAEGRFLSVLLDQVRNLPAAPLSLTLPRDKRILPIAEALISAPANTQTLAAWSSTIGGSERTLARLFIKETGMTFGQWRQQARLHAALSQLAEGAPVGQTAADLGYESQSAFIAMFRKALGKTPKQYFS